MKKRKETMYDFGELGKWSKETLKQHTIKNYYGSYHNNEYKLTVDFIEDAYSKKKKPIYDRMDNIYSIKVSGFINSLTIRELAYSMDILTDLKKELDKLNKGYDEYKKVMDSMIKNKK